MELENGDMQACATKRRLQPRADIPQIILSASLRPVVSEKFNSQAVDAATLSLCSKGKLRHQEL